MINFAAACMARTVTREQWHAERRRRGQAARDAAERARYLTSVRHTRERMPVPVEVATARVTWRWQALRGRLCGHMTDRLIRERYTERNARMLGHIAGLFDLPTWRRGHFYELCRWVRDGEPERETALRVAEEMHLGRHAVERAA